MDGMQYFNCFDSHLCQEMSRMAAHWGDYLIKVDQQITRMMYVHNIFPKNPKKIIFNTLWTF